MTFSGFLHGIFIINLMFTVSELLFLGMGYNTLDSRKTMKQRRFVRKSSATPSGSKHFSFQLYLYLIIAFINMRRFN